MHDDDLGLWFSLSGLSQGKQDSAQGQNEILHMMHHIKLVRVARFGCN
jgi:hypothetical protein